MNVLYLTYDGLTDHIGRSQVLPYLLGCAVAGHRMTVISFEKPNRIELTGKVVAEICESVGISWRPLPFRTKPRYVAKLLDHRAMRLAASRAASETTFDLVHCRSYVAGTVGLDLKHKSGTAMLFDMRGLWPDQRRDGRRWTGMLGGALYRRWKGHEKRLVAGSDHLVVLSEAVREEIRRWPSYPGTPVSVIPCCADFDLFSPASPTERSAARRALGIDESIPVLGYLGSLGTVYLAEQHFRLFAAIRKIAPGACLLFVGSNSVGEIVALGATAGVALVPDEVRCVGAERDQVPYWLGAFDAGTCFITPAYSSLGVSPTKLGEYLACGIPVIANRGVGDVETILDSVNGGHVVAGFGDEQLAEAARQFLGLIGEDRAALRERARPLLDLPKAIDAYCAIYDDLATAATVGAK